MCVLDVECEVPVVHKVGMTIHYTLILCIILVTKIEIPSALYY